MKIKKTSVYAFVVIITLSLFGCVDNAYDLSDIDSTIGVKVNELVVPFNLDDITLQNILNLEDDSQIKEINGEYAFSEEGSFKSDPIEIPSFIISAPQANPISDTLDMVAYDIGTSPSLFATNSDNNRLFTAEVNKASTTFSIESQSIDPALIKIDRIGTNFLIKLSISIIGLDAILNSIEIQDISIELPKGLKATVSDDGVYDPSTGLLTYNTLLLSDENLQKDLTISVSEIDTDQAGLILANGELSLVSTTYFSSTFAIYEHNLKESVDMDEVANLKKLTYQLDINFPNGDIEVTHFTGDIHYKLDGIGIPSITIDNIPSLLEQEGTDVRISNPQIYLSIKNPVYRDYQIYAKAGIELTPTPKSNLTFHTQLTFDKAESNLCLSPLPPDNMYVPGATHVPFTNLGNILSGSELPSKIDIKVTDPEVPQQTVSNFRLGDNLGTIQGTYKFYAPLALTDKSQIHYTETIDGWSDDELENLTVENLQIEATVESNIPFGFTATAYPIDKNGNNLTKDGQPIEAILKTVGADGTSTNLLPALAHTSVLIDIDGPLHNLDGIILKAILSGAEGNLSLKPNQQIQFTAIKVKVSGEYINEL